MRIDGKAIAEEIFEKLKKRVQLLDKRNIIPTLVIILIGENPASVAYVRQKVLKAKQIGAEALEYKLPSDISEEKLLLLLTKLNFSKEVHGVIVQRPLPSQIDEKVIDEAVDPQKDVDGFHSETTFTMPLAAAVLKVLEHIFIRCHLAQGGTFPNKKPRASFNKWLKSKNIVVFGKGSTGGRPMIEALKRREANVMVVDSKTPNPEEISKQADIIIAAIGRPNIIKPSMIKQGAILIGVGMHRGEDSKLHGDYNEEGIKDIASYYTPIPGGIGPVNVAMLLENVVIACENQSTFES